MTRITRRLLTGGALASSVVAGLAPRAARAQSPARPIKIGIMSDMSGPYAEATGPGDVLAARFAIEDFSRQHPEIKVDLVYADMLLKPDVGASIARSWYDQEGVDVILDIPQSAVALAVGGIAKEKDKLVIFTSAGLADLTGKYCSPNHIQWTYDLWANANGIAKGLVATGGDTWFFIIADYISGHGMANDCSEVVKQLGGREVGRVAYAFPGTTDFSSQLLAAKASGAKVICLANAGDDTSNCIKQAFEFGIPQSGVKLGSLVMQDYIIKSVGLPTAQGLVGAMPFCWNMNADTIAFADRFTPLYRGNKPNYYHAASYSAVTHYLKAVAAMGPDKARASGRATAEQMKAIPVDDKLLGKGSVRADGKHIHNMYVWQTKTEQESKGPWDYFKLLQTIPGEQAFKSMAALGCPFTKA
jgi:branched-chain amino acid transport system substrate-binding protein